MGKRLSLRMRKRQLSFEGSEFKSVHCFGGSLLKGNARSRRPIDTKLPLHLVLRADVQGRQSMRSPHVFNKVNTTVTGLIKKYGLTLYEYANVGNHLHLLLKVPNRRLWARFIRELTGRVAQVTQGLKGPQKGRKFWTHKPFTRVVQGWGRAYKAVKEYVVFNQWEAEGFISRKETRTLRELREIWDAPFS